MYLVDCFVPVIAFVTGEVEKMNAGINVDYGEFRQGVLSRMNVDDTALVSIGYSRAHYDSATFAVAAFTDEQVMSSNWQQKHLWGSALLQQHYFDTTRAGVEFFSRMDALNPFNPNDRDVREVYFYCLSLGFVGQYYRPGDKFRLDEIMTATGDMLCRGVKTDVLLPRSEMLSSRASVPERGFRMPEGPLYIGLPVLLLLLIYIVFRNGILSTINELLLAI